MRSSVIAGLGALVLAGTSPAFAAPAGSCHGGQSFEAFMQNFRSEAAAAGISTATLSAALDGVRFDQSVVDRDRAQGVFAQTFSQFATRMVEGYRLPQGQQRLKKNADVFARIEAEFGVPGPVLVAFWGLETDFGANMGDGPTIQSLATLAYDCRRPEMFKEQLTAAMRIVERGDLTPATMRGPWAGELGQFQFLPAHYLDYGVDYDGDGHINLISSTPDALASAAKYIQSLGWKRGEPWIEAVRLPADLAWEESGLHKTHPAGRWAEWGVAPVSGSSLAGAGEASLILPEGRNGPAFLVYGNFRDVYLKWNQSLVYSLTAAYYASRLDGAPRFEAGTGEGALSLENVRELQRLLAGRGHDVGKIDGIIGAGTRAAVRSEQLRLGLPADAYPDQELMRRLAGG